jgi:predicted NAD/FAD-dependent oxidoreductase
MISKKDLKQYNFSDLNQYFDYILESEVNGQFEQVESLILSLSKPQRVELLTWLTDEMPDKANDSYTQVYKKCLSLLKR